MHRLSVQAAFAGGATETASARVRVVRPSPVPTTPGTVLWGTDFEDGNAGVYRTVAGRLGRRGTRRVTTERARTGVRSLKVTLPAATSGGTVGRYQLVPDMPDGVRGEDRWYGFSQYLDRGSGPPEIAVGRAYFAGFFGFRWKGTLANGPGSDLDGLRSGRGPAFGIAVNLTGTTAPPRYRLLGPIVRNQWIDWVVHIRWAMGRRGIQEVWRDGVKVAEYHGRTMLYNHAFEQRIGVYEGVAVNRTRTLYIDNHRVGTSYAAVDPSR